MIIPSQWRVEHQRPKRRALEIMLRSQWGEQSKKFRLAAAIAFSYDYGHTSTNRATSCFAHACKLGLEGIVSKRKDSSYRSWRSPDWLKMKNSDAPAVRREAEEDWGK